MIVDTRRPSSVCVASFVAGLVALGAVWLIVALLLLEALNPAYFEWSSAEFWFFCAVLTCPTAAVTGLILGIVSLAGRERGGLYAILGTAFSTVTIVLFVLRLSLVI